MMSKTHVSEGFDLDPHEVQYLVKGPIDNHQLSALYGEEHNPTTDWDWAGQIQTHSLTWITARHRGRLVGFVNVAWDGGVHAFLLDTVVEERFRHKGIGTRLVQEAISEVARHPRLEWIHVDSSEELMSDFYSPAGFFPTSAGLVWLPDVRKEAR